MPQKSSDFDPLLLASIDEALLSLGESVKKSIYFHLEKNFKVTRNDIPAHLAQFQTGLEKIFGLGARFLEILIMKNLYAKIGCPLIMEKNDDLEFAKYVESAKATFIKGCHGENDC
jgi:hypothetical protein